MSHGSCFGVLGNLTNKITALNMILGNLTNKIVDNETNMKGKDGNFQLTKGLHVMQFYHNVH